MQSISLYSLFMLWAANAAKDALRSRSMQWVTTLPAFAVFYAVSSEQFSRIFISDRTFPSLELTCLSSQQVNKGRYRHQHGQQCWAGSTKPQPDAGCASCLPHPPGCLRAAACGQAACASPLLSKHRLGKDITGSSRAGFLRLFSNSVLGVVRNSDIAESDSEHLHHELYCWVSGISISSGDMFRKAFTLMSKQSTTISAAESCASAG